MRNPNAKVSDPNEFVTCPGDPIQIQYESKVMPDGTIVLKESGKKDLQEEINSFLTQTDIFYITSRLAVGDTSVLNPNPAMYGDFTEAPKSLQHAMQTMIDGEKAFYQLPLEVRNRFDNNFRQWLFSVGSEDWIKKMTVADQEPAAQEVKEEVKADE